MTTFTIKINERTKAGKAFKAMTETFFKDVKGIEIIEEKEEKEEKEDEIYDPEFVKMILERGEGINNHEKRKNWTVIDPNDIWGSLK